MAGCEGLSHTTACQRCRRGGGRRQSLLRLSGTGNEIDRRNRKYWLGLYHFCAILNKASHRYSSSASTVICIKNISAPNIGRSNILNHFASWCLFVYSILLQRWGAVDSLFLAFVFLAQIQPCVIVWYEEKISRHSVNSQVCCAACGLIFPPKVHLFDVRQSFLLYARCSSTPLYTGTCSAHTSL